MAEGQRPPVARDRTTRRRNAGGAGTKVRRIHDHWEQLGRLATNENWGSQIGRLFLLDEITNDQAAILERYGEIVGRFDRYHLPPGMQRHARSPSYERGYGKEDEIIKRQNDGTLPAYERRARRAKKQWLKIQSALPESLKALLDEVVVWDRHIPALTYPDLLIAIRLLSHQHSFRNGRGLIQEDGKRRKPSRAERAQRMAIVVTNRLAEYLASEKREGEVRYRLASRKETGERGAFVYSQDEKGKALVCSAYVRNDEVPPDQVDALIEIAAQNQGWVRYDPNGSGPSASG
jgi:hypothetical protein